MISKIMITVIVLAILRLLYQVIHYRFFHPLSNFRGPFWASVTRLWIAYHHLMEDECTVFWNLHKLYGMRVWLAKYDHQLLRSKGIQGQ